MITFYHFNILNIKNNLIRKILERNLNEIKQLLKEVKSLNVQFKFYISEQKEKDFSCNDEYLTIKEAIFYTNNSDSWFRKKIKDGKLKTKKRGAKLLIIKKDDIDKLNKGN
jgi:uncharacterized membrane protein